MNKKVVIALFLGLMSGVASAATTEAAAAEEVLGTQLTNLFAVPTIWFRSANGPKSWSLRELAELGCFYLPKGDDACLHLKLLMGGFSCSYHVHRERGTIWGTPVDLYRTSEFAASIGIGPALVKY